MSPLINRLVRFGATGPPDGARPRGLAGIGLAIILAGLGVALAVSIVLAVTLGPADISPVTAWRIGIHQFWPEAAPADWPTAHERIV